MADPRHLLGRRAEDAAAAWLESAGWKLLERRFRSSAGGEVDLVLVDPDGVLVGVEVRARRSQRAGAPEESVDAERVDRIARSLAAFARQGLAHTGLRVDLVTALPVEHDGRTALRLTRLPSITP